MKKKLLKGLAILGTIAVSMEIANKVAYSKAKKLENTLGGEASYHDTVFGKIFYTKKGYGPPLLLVHDVSIGSSSFIWRKNFEELSNNFTVYAMDLPGFGKSEKRSLTYTSDVYTYILKNFVDEVIKKPCYCIASSISSAYAIQVEYDDPGTFSKIIAVSPTGIFHQSKNPGKTGNIKNKAFRVPILGSFAHNMLSSKKALSSFMKNKIYNNKDLVSTYVVSHYNDSSKQDGELSKYAFASYVSGYLNQPIPEALANLDIPLYIIWGADSVLNPIENLKSFIDINPSVNYYVFDNCGEFPQEEYSPEFNKIAIDFFNKDM